MEGGDVQSTKPVSAAKNVCDIPILGREFAGLLQHQSGHGAQPPAEGEGRQEEVEEDILYALPYLPPSLCSSKPSSIKIVSLLLSQDDSAFIWMSKCLFDFFACGENLKKPFWNNFVLFEILIIWLYLVELLYLSL